MATPKTDEIERVRQHTSDEFTGKDWEVFEHLWYWSARELIQEALGLKGKALHEATWRMWLAYKDEEGWRGRDARVLEERKQSEARVAALVGERG